MAILRGFPPSNTISPSVRIKETDLSLILPAPSAHRAGMVGFCSKGPINIPTSIATRRELHRTFGFPHPDESDPYMIYAAEQYLLVANELFIVRVADESPVSDEQAQTATVDVPSSGTTVQVESDTAGPYTFGSDSFFRWRLNGVLLSKTLVVLADTYTTDELVEELNAQLDSDIDGIIFYAATGDKIAVRTTFAYGPDAELELVAVQDAIYGGAVLDGNVTGLGTGMEQASVTGTKNKYPQTAYQTQGMYDFTGLTDLNLQVVIEGTDNVLIDDVVQVIDLEDLEGLEVTANDIVNEINSQALGFTASSSAGAITLSTDSHGRDAKMLVKTASTADAILGLANTTVNGVSPVGVTGDADIHTVGRATGAADGSGGITFTLAADSPGIEGNATEVVIANDIRTGSFTFNVYSNGVESEQWGGLTKNQTSRLYVESFLSLASDYVRVTDNTSNPATPVAGTYALSGGTDGIPADPDEQDALIIGNELGMTGLHALSDPEQVDIDLIAVPGHASTDVVTELLRLCRDIRLDCFAIIDPPFGLTVSEIVDWQNGVHPLNLTRFDNDFGALYWPWLRLRDTTNRIDVWVPPSGSILAVYARSDELAAPWFAPAGLSRGVVPNISDVFSRPSLEERDLMYGNRNAVNPIVQFNDIQDFVVFGQKTLQRAPTALDRVNVRRMMLFVEKQIKRRARLLLFEPHDEILREQFVSLATDVLEEVKSQRGITDFRVQCDAELNPPDVIDRNELRARVAIQPTRAVEFIFIDFSIHRTGSFAENADTF
jgi:uncharacterized protein